MSKSLTDRQREVLDFIRKEIKKISLPPTVREIGEHFGIASPRGVSDHLAALEKKGYIVRDAGKSRAIKLTSKATHIKMTGIPIVGTVAAGHPILSEENYDGVLDIDGLFGTRDLFAVAVRGESMIECGIMEGDYVIVKRNGNFENGTIAVAYVEGEATVKRLFKTRSGYRLKAENKDYDDIIVDRKTASFEVAGPVIGVVRSM
jgi:repressor LexA